MDKLLFNRLNEKRVKTDRFSFKNTNKCCNMETMEGSLQKTMGFTKIRDTKRFGKKNLIYGKSLSMDSDKNLCIKSDISKDVLFRKGLISCLDYYNRMSSGVKGD